MTDFVTIEKQEYDNLLYYKNYVEERDARLNIMALQIDNIKRKLDLDNYGKPEATEDNLSQRHLDVLQILKSNPGCNKQFIVNFLDGKYSRVTVFKLLDDLVKWNLIDIEREKLNSQNLKLFLKDEDLQIGLIKDLDLFERSFFELTYKIKKENDRLLLFEILRIFFDFISLSFLISFINWTHEIKNKKILYYINRLTFEKLLGFQSNLMIELEGIDQSILKDFLNFISENQLRFLSLTSYSNCYNKFKENNLGHEIAVILDFLFDLRNKLIDDLSFRQIGKCQDNIF
ncbi:hypothetical protein [Candidatus Nitrosocosmicus franklandus]|uniref:Uncharacterized protein n=1 Tax=Candidatus Nitrosocosmicus franklandianus TaxID=1798806 RepID=A0A484IB54_9ARCH|nr:hypothetical protein [Candidatus Nitrosocosmicus franklandus]VFJ14525.1 protein of unknown function [Candidatus Nitrosocosmicus franklandus]